MIPIRLTIQGLYSYQEKKQSIDFTKLTDANIFGIFGSVGSGKSSILEAITFALYGETDRLNLRDSRNYNMMNLKSNELFIELIFKAGKDNNEYQVSVKAKRNSKRFDDVRTLDRLAYKKENNSWIPIELDSIENIIGLSYENFKRTIIIPQGKFQEFLQLGNKDRTQMMKELFNLNKYELYYKVVSLESKNKEKKDKIDGQLQQIGEIKPELIKENQKILETVKKEILALSKDLENKQKQETELKQLKVLFDKKTEQKEKWTNLNNQKKDFEKLDKKIKEYENCLLNFKNLLDTFAANSEKIKQFDLLVAEDNTLLITIANRIKDLEAEFERIKKDYEKREKLKQQAEELEKIARLIELNNNSIVLDDRIKTGEEFYNITLTQLEQLKKENNSISESLKALKKQLPDLGELSKIKEWHTVNKSLNSTDHESKKEQRIIQNEIDEIKKQIKHLWVNECFKDVPKTKEPKKAIVDLNNKIENYKNQIIGIDKEIEQLSVQTKLEEYAGNLHDGEACPLCGSLSHPDILNAHNVAEALQKARDNKNKINDVISTIDKYTDQLSGFLTKLQLKQEQMIKVRIKQKDLDVKVEKHQKSFVWKDYQEEEAVKKAFSEAEKIQKELKNKEEELEKSLRDIEKENQNKEKYKNALEKFKIETASNQSEIFTLINQIKILSFDEFKNKDITEIKELSESLLNKYSELEELYNKTNSKIMELQKENNTISVKLEVNKKMLKQELTSKKQIEKKINEQLVKSEYKTINEVEFILSQKISLETEKKKVNDYIQALIITETRIAELNKDIGDKKYNKLEHIGLQEKLLELTEKQKKLNQEHGKIEGEIKKLQIDIENQKELRKNMELLELRAEDIKTLKSMFKASGFVNYISSVYLQNLCNAANDRFYKLTRQKLSLEITEDNNFQVRDFMNGGKVRNVKTLSGGQTFQAALSLALSLANNIQKITESDQNFFFLDEGFGALDKEALDVVFETLKSLRKENRIVGVISHVEEMQYEIDTHLLITNNEENGSIIKESWKN